MEKELGTKIIDSVERIFRYLNPGVLFFILFFLSYPSKVDEVIYKISDSNLLVFLVVLAVGMSIYTVHSQLIRCTLELIVFQRDMSPVNLFSDNRNLVNNYLRALAKLNLSREKSFGYPKGYYVYLWSFLHYSFMMSELLILSSYFHEKNSFIDHYFLYVFSGGVVLLVISISSYFYMQNLEKYTTEELNRAF